MQVHPLPQSSRALRSLALAANTKRWKPPLYQQIEAIAGQHAAAGAVIVELGFSSARECKRLVLQACARPSHDGVRVRLLTLQIRVIEPELARIGAITRRAIEAFGGTRFVGVEAARFGRVRQPRPADGLDVSVVFPSEFPFFAQNVVFIPRLRSVAETADFADVLSALGVEHVLAGGMLRAARHQWRLPMRVESQVRAFECALNAGLRSALYSAPLPANSSARLELVSRERRELECILSRGFGSPRGCSRYDLEQMQSFVFEQFGVELEALNHRVKVTPAFAPRAASPAQRAR